MMNKAIFYKEWLKTRWCMLAACIIYACYTLYLLMRLGNVVEIRGAEHLWSILLTRDSVFLEPFQYIPMLTGLALGVVQFIPEIMQKRLKLTLHLPYPNVKMVLMMFLSGLCLLLPLLLLQLAVFWAYFQSFLAPELTRHILLTVLPWYLAGIVGYIWTYAVCVEPTWRMRAVLLLCGAGLLKLHFLEGVPQSYDSFLPLLLVYGLAGTVLLIRSMYRFKEGCQD